MAFAPTISVLVPAFNRAGLIEETLESLLAQTYLPRPEILVVDDGSTDATPEILRGYGDRIRVFHQENRGAAAARNLALKSARGDFIAFCDSDDLWTPDKLERQIALFQTRPRAGFVYGRFLCFESSPDGIRREWALDRPTPSGFIFPALLERNFIVPATAVVRRSALDAVGEFDTACCNAEDYDLFLRLAIRFEAIYDEGLSCYYRQHGVTASRQKERYWRGFLRSLQKTRELVRALQRDGRLLNPVDGRPVPPSEIRRWEALLRRRIASFHLRLAGYSNRNGLSSDAWREAAAAFRLTPTNPQAWTAVWKALRGRLGSREHP